MTVQAIIDALTTGAPDPDGTDCVRAASLPLTAPGVASRISRVGFFFYWIMAEHIEGYHGAIWVNRPIYRPRLLLYCERAC